MAFVLQSLDMPDWYVQFEPFGAYFIIALLAINILISFMTRNKFSKARLIKKTIFLMRNATENIVMFGGDLSWAEDYEDVIKELTGDGKTVIVIFPFSKISNFSRNASTRFDTNVLKLKMAGAIIYYTENDHNLRCTIIDIGIERAREDMKVISSKRINRHSTNQSKNQYRVNYFQYKKDHEKAFCNLYYNNYVLIKDIIKRYFNE